MNNSLAVFTGALLLAGCAAPAAPHGGTSTPALPSAASVDLHKFTLNITMPAGNSSAVILLDITKDMWVEWKSPTGADRPDGWTLEPAALTSVLPLATGEPAPAAPDCMA